MLLLGSTWRLKPLQNSSNFASRPEALGPEARSAPEVLTCRKLVCDTLEMLVQKKTRLEKALGAVQ